FAYTAEYRRQLGAYFQRVESAARRVRPRSLRQWERQHIREWRQGAGGRRRFRSGLLLLISQRAQPGAQPFGDAVLLGWRDLQQQPQFRPVAVQGELLARPRRSSVQVRRRI